MAVEQLQVPAGISLDTAVVAGEGFTYKQISVFEPCVTIPTNCECTEMFLLNSEDAPEAKICMTESRRGSQLTESLLLTALETLYSVPIPSRNPLPPCRCSATYSKSKYLLHAVLWTTYWRRGCCKNQRFASDLRCYVCSYIFISYW